MAELPEGGGPGFTAEQLAEARAIVPQMAAFAASREDHLQYLVDVLENLPPKKPTPAMLSVQLASPIVLMAKTGVDAIAALVSLPTKHEWTNWISLVVNLCFFGVGLYGVAAMRAQYREAMDRTDPHHARILKRAKSDLAREQRLIAAGHYAGPAHDTLSSPKKSLTP